MKAADVMTRDLISVEQDASILTAARLMLQKHVSGLPVVDPHGNLVGIITEGDFLRRTEMGTQRHRPRWLEFIVGPGALAEEYVHASGRKVHEIMTPEVHTVSEETALEEVVTMMEKRRIKRVPVVHDKKVVGIITRANLMRALIHVALQAKPESQSDGDIRYRLRKELEKQPWFNRSYIHISVSDGIVKLSGAIFDDRERQALRVAAENVRGVKKVEDDLVWIDAAMTDMVAD